MKLMNWALKKLKLVRQAEHDSKIKANHDFTILIGNAAKAAGVNIILNDELVSAVAFDSDLFVIGSRNHIININLVGSTIRFGPQSQFNVISYVRAVS